MTTNPYVPIDCDQHSVLEVLAMRRARVSARAWDASGGEITVHGVVEDVYTRSAAEYLVIRDAAGGVHSIRLDRLRSLYDESGGPVWRQKNAGI